MTSTDEYGNLADVSPDFTKRQLYASLPLQGECIRIVTISPGQGSEPITCTLETQTLDVLGRGYKALSYVWGEVIHQNPIYVNGCRFAVIVDLYHALLRLREFELPVCGRRHWVDAHIGKRYWIDAICIDQEK